MTYTNQASSSYNLNALNDPTTLKHNGVTTVINSWKEIPVSAQSEIAGNFSRWISQTKKARIKDQSIDLFNSAVSKLKNQESFYLDYIGMIIFQSEDGKFITPAKEHYKAHFNKEMMISKAELDILLLDPTSRYISVDLTKIDKMTEGYLRGYFEAVAVWKDAMAFKRKEHWNKILKQK